MSSLLLYMRSLANPNSISVCVVCRSASVFYGWIVSNTSNAITSKV